MAALEASRDLPRVVIDDRRLSREPEAEIGRVLRELAEVGVVAGMTVGDVAVHAMADESAVASRSRTTLTASSVLAAAL